jgi:hypothetical protein
MTVMTRIKLADEFSAFPFGRFAQHGPYNGERFRKEFLVPALKAGDVVEVDLAGAKGLSPSFLEEAFGGLVRREGFDRADMLARIRVLSERDPSFVTRVNGYISAATPA